MTIKELANALLAQPEEVQSAQLFQGGKAVESYEILIANTPLKETGLEIFLNTKAAERMTDHAQNHHEV